MVGYIDSSVILRHILIGDTELLHASACSIMVTSELAEIECRRVLQRERLTGNLDDETLLTAISRLNKLLQGMYIMHLSGEIKKRAMGSFPVVIKTLDALHIASAVQLAADYASEPVLVFSYDGGMNRCCSALGFSVPLAEI